MSDVLVLCYHAVSDRWRSSLAISPASLERQIEQVLERGYQGATFTEAICSPPARKTLAVTFDDAFRSTLLAAPILARLAVPGTVFVPTGFVGQAEPMSWPGIEEWVDSEHGAELKCMDWNELRELSDKGWEIGSHTVSHPVLPQLDDDELGGELQQSREELSDRLGLDCRSIAYPYGLCDDRVVGAAGKAGYTAGGTLTRWPHPTQPRAWPRIGAYEGRNWLFRLKTSSTLRRLASSSGNGPGSRRP